MYKIFFDMDDTLYDMMEPFGAAFRGLYGNAHKDTNLRELFVLSRRYSDAMFEDAMSGRMPMAEMNLIRMQKACRDMGIDMSREDAEQFQSLYEQNQKGIRLSPGIRDLLTDLKNKDCFLGIISNGPSQHQRRKLQTLGISEWIPHDHIIISGELQVSKPDPAIFQLTVDRFGGSAEDYLYVGDTFKNDIVGAKAAGWKAVWINRRDVRPDTDVRPDYVVHDDIELFQLLSK